MERNKKEASSNAIVGNEITFAWFIQKSKPPSMTAGTHGLSLKSVLCFQQAYRHRQRKEENTKLILALKEEGNKDIWHYHAASERTINLAMLCPLGRTAIFRRV
jgi:hypothetical protein